MKCPKCSSENLEVFSAEISFATGESALVYSIQKTTVCLDCGFSEGIVSAEALKTLRTENEERTRGRPGDEGANRS